MSKFDNKLCPICRTPFNERSDVVVCPICGTPHHRACYLRYNRCGAEGWHDSGFVWNGRLPDEEPEQPEEPEESRQPEQSAIAGGEPQNTDPHHAEYPSGTPQGENAGGQPIDLDEYLSGLTSRTMDETRGEDGVSSKELSFFVGRSVMHYSQAFAVFRAPALPGQKKRRVFFNLCSGLFAPVHQFYRRMDLVGILLLLIEVAYYIPAVLGVSGIVSTDMIGAVQMFANGLSFLSMIGMSLFGDYIYYRMCVKRIKKIRLNYDDGRADGYYQALAEKGSPSWLRAIIAILTVYFVQACLMLYVLQIDQKV